MTSPEPYLIAHRVRGEPAFDIAIQLEGSGTPSDPGPWWIIPTSGHRAYPYWSDRLETFCYGLSEIVPSCPQDWPDHYSASPAPPGTGTITAGSLLERLGLVAKATIRRR